MSTLWQFGLGSLKDQDDSQAGGPKSKAESLGNGRAYVLRSCLGGAIVCGDGQLIRNTIDGPAGIHQRA